MMQGMVEVSSELGVGTTFTVTLPVQSEKAREEAPAIVEGHDRSQAKPGEILKDKRILSVDDHPTNLMMMRRLLVKMGAAEVVEVEDGADAMDAFCHQGPFDLVIMDFHMPGMDGLQATRAIRAYEEEQNHQHTPILIVTADAMKETFEKCLEAGVDDYITKPISRQQLIQTIGKYVIIPENERGISERNQAPSDDPVDLNHFRDFSDGEADVEIEFYKVYARQATECLRELKSHLDAGDDEEWRKMSHKLKGASANLGAFALSELCKQAEDGFEEDVEVKQDWYNAITAELGRVDAFMKALHPELS